MAFHRFGALALAASLAASAREASPYFAGTSPFYMFSSSTLESSAFEYGEIAASTDVETVAANALSGCPSDTYIFVTQPGVDAADFQAEGAAQYLAKWWSPTGGKRTQFWTAVAQVQGKVDTDGLSASLAKECGAKEMKLDGTAGDLSVESTYPRVITVDFPSPSWGSERVSTLAAHDWVLNDLLSGLKSSDSYSVIFTTSPPTEPEPLDAPHSEHTYEMDDAFPDSPHIELKRDMGSRDENNTIDYDLPLFEKYQFLSPAIFMGILFFLFFFMILYAGITAVSSVQVSYFAFSKEMGPSAQKKQ